MYIQKLEEINQQFKQVNSLTSQNFEEVIKKLKSEGKNENATNLEGLLDNLNTEMDEVISILVKISLFMEKNSDCLS